MAAPLGRPRPVVRRRPSAADQRVSEAERLQDATITGIANVTALLRRVTEARRGGVSRESQLRHLAQWFAALPADGDAHALFQAVFGLGGPRHVASATTTRT